MEERSVRDGEEEAWFDLEARIVPDALYRLEFALRDEWSSPMVPDSFARNIQDFELRGNDVALLDSQRRHFDDFLEAIADAELAGTEVVDVFCPGMGKILVDQENACRHFCQQVFLRWKNSSVGRRIDHWQDDCHSIVGEVFSQAKIEDLRLMEAIARNALREADEAGSEELMGWWLYALVQAGLLKKFWGPSSAELIKRNPPQPARISTHPSVPATLLEEIYKAVSWSSAEIAVTFLETLRRNVKKVVCGGRPVAQVECRASDEEWPLLVFYRAKAQAGVPRGAGLSSTGRRFLDTASFHRVQPEKWTPPAQRFVLAWFQRGLAWGVLSCSEEHYNRIHEFGKSFCAEFGPEYLRQLCEAEQDLRSWINVRKRS
jgi:hypothetical protein